MRIAEPILFIVLAATAFGIAALEIFCYFGPGQDGTPSRILARWGRQWIVIPFAVGFCAFHLFAPDGTRTTARDYWTDKAVVAMLLGGWASSIVW